MSETRSVLFVCLGNICRSPTVEAVARELAKREAPELNLQFDSAGTSNYHPGAAPDPRSQRAAMARGYDLSGLRARQVNAVDFQQFDLILGMDAENLSELKRMAPAQLDHKLSRFLDHCPQHAGGDVPDPYYGGPADFERVLELAEAGSRALFVAIAAERRR